MKNIEHLTEEQRDALIVQDKRHVKLHRPRRNFNVNVNHLKRWLRTNLGRRVDDIVSDYTKLSWIPTEFRTSSYLLSHFIEKDTFLENGKEMVFERWMRGRSAIPIQTWDRKSFYVKPADKTLGYHAPKKRKYNSNPVDFIKLAPFDQLLKLRGIWYHVYIDKQHHDTVRAKYSEKYRLMVETAAGNTVTFPYCFDIPASIQVHKKQLDSLSLDYYALTNDIVVNNSPCPVCGGSKCQIH